MLGRRFLILVAVLMGLTALAASFAPRQPTPREERQASTPTARTCRLAYGHDRREVGERDR